MAIPAPRARILSTGSEILHGLYPDTNAQNLSRLLFERGFRVVGHAAAPDEPALIRRALEEAMRDCDLLVMTGGLGPTEDDVNRDIVAAIHGRSLQFDERAGAMMRERFEARGIPMPERNVVQAMMPEGSVTLYNYWGTAPGFVLPASGGLPVLVALPGPPGEWRPMIEGALPEVILPLFPERPLRRVLTLHVAMTPESVINEELASLFGAHDDLELTLLARRGYIRIRLIAEGMDESAMNDRLLSVREEVLSRLGEDLPFAEGPEEISSAAAMVELLRGRVETLALAESCTGGAIASAITDMPGASRVLMAGWVTYSNEAKCRDLGVAPDLIAAHGAVSEPVVRAMAEHARERAGADWAISVSGVAGPGGGTPDKPVGTVWIGISGADGSGTTAHRHLFRGDRTAVREWSVNQALELLRRRVHRLDPEALLRPRRIG